MKLLIVAAGLAVSLATVSPAAAGGPVNLQALQFNAPIPMRTGQTNLFSAFYRHFGSGDVPAGTVFTVQLPKGIPVDTSRRIGFTVSTHLGLTDMGSGCSASGSQVTCRTTAPIPGRPDAGANELSITVPVRVLAAPGSYVATYAADTTNLVVESVERDNTATRTIAVN